MSVIDFIQQEYKENKDSYLSLEKITHRLIKHLINKEKIQIHSITSRCKTESSLMEKVNRPDKNYKKLSEINDVLGIRITTYFSDEIDLISQLIHNEFLVDQDNSTDKRKTFESDRFGYMSLHLVAEYSNARTKLIKYKNCENIKFEIQIRTILQHAWAEIEHDIGYKSKSQVPINLRRRFSRLSGLLELVDEEFHSIRQEINTYKDQLSENIVITPSSVFLDLDSLDSFINNDTLVQKIESQFNDVLDCPLIRTDKASLRRFLGHVNRLGINTIEELKSVYKESEPYILAYLKAWLSISYKYETNPKIVNRGISIIYVCRIILALRNDDELFSNYLKGSIYSSKAKMKSMVLKTFDQIQDQDNS